MTDPILDSLFATLETDREDLVTFAALADRFEERGESAIADALRWLAARQLRPGFHTSLQYGRFFWECESDNPLCGDPLALLPPPLWDRLRDNGEPGTVVCFKSYRNAHAAIQAFIDAWFRLPSVAIEIAPTHPQSQTDH